MKLYEKTFLKATWARRLRYKHTLGAGFEWADRSELFNNTNFSFGDRTETIFRPNRPVNQELGSENVIAYQVASKAYLYYAVKPWLKFRKYNGRLIPIESTSPELRLTYRKGIDGLLGSDVNYDHLEFGLTSQIETRR